MAKEKGRRKTIRRNKTRGEEYAEATGQAILDAARRLFCRNGFFSTWPDGRATTPADAKLICEEDRESVWENALTRQTQDL
jgi:hypothetical protein